MSGWMSDVGLYHLQGRLSSQVENPSLEILGLETSKGKVTISKVTASRFSGWVSMLSGSAVSGFPQVLCWLSSPDLQGNGAGQAEETPFSLYPVRPGLLVI